MRIRLPRPLYGIPQCKSFAISQFACAYWQKMASNLLRNAARVASVAPRLLGRNPILANSTVLKTRNLVAPLYSKGIQSKYAI